MTVRDDCAVSACSPPDQTPVYKCSHPLLVRGWGESAFGQMFAIPCSLPFSCHLKWSKLSFPPSWPAYWLLSGEQSDTLCIPFGNNERWQAYFSVQEAPTDTFHWRAADPTTSSLCIISLSFHCKSKSPSLSWFPTELLSLWWDS